MRRSTSGSRTCSIRRSRNARRRRRSRSRNMAVPDSVRLPLSFDPALLARDLEKFSSADWISHYIQDRYEGDWSVIPLRGVAGARHPIQMIYADPAAKDFEYSPMLGACPYFRKVIDIFECPLGPVRR